MKVRHFALFAFGVLLAMTAGVYAQSGGYPTRARFNSVGIGQGASSMNGSLNVTGTSPTLAVNESDGDNSSFLRFDDIGTTRAYVGSVNAVNGLCTGGAEGDLCLRVTSGRIIGSVDGGASSVDLTPASGTFTASFDTACTTTPTITYDYQRIGNVVTLWSVNQAGWACTSDSANTITTTPAVPAAIRPTAQQSSAQVVGLSTTDNGAVTGVRFDILTDGNINIANCPYNANCTAWTAAGSKNAAAQTFVMTYGLGNP